MAAKTEEKEKLKTIYTPCSRCNETGKYKGEKCPACKGRGKVVFGYVEA
jgi:DnaJ-class molecular chaperone